MLFLDHNEPAFDYTPKEAKPLELSENEIKMNLTQHMINFFTLYVSQDSVGTIANSHLANSDLYGINSKHCLSIALKHNQAVDFVKSGVLPPELTKKWEGDDLPPEKVPKFYEKNHVPTYKSSRLLGNLHSRATEVREFIRVEEISSVDEIIKIDESVLMPGDAIYQDIAQSAYHDYRTLIRSICETYGINNEGQLFSGCFTASKKQINGKDDDQMANVQRIVEEQVATIYAKFRSNFFDEFGGIIKNTELDERKHNGVRETFRRFWTISFIWMAYF
uniref:RNA-dependent RNA polymerase n=1 Tax=Panagrolaimus superbus TaxID=310955 RepID=A0A914XXS8_9BILA